MSSEVSAFGREDMTHVTPDVMNALLKMAHKDGGGDFDQAVVRVMALVHYNPSLPGNMNVYVPSAKKDALVYDGKAWRTRYNSTTVFNMACGCAARLMEHVEDGGGEQLPRAVAEAFSTYYDRIEPDGALESRARKMAHDLGFLVLLAHPECGATSGKGRSSSAASSDAAASRPTPPL